MAGNAPEEGIELVSRPIPVTPQTSNRHVDNGTLVDHDITVGTAIRPGPPITERKIAEDPEKTVQRKLRGIHLFMITINGTLGTGLYVRSGQILELGGPVAVLASFVLLGIVAWSVMQCITELLCLWPIPGALPLFVESFVDQELGIAVGVAYWFTYSVGFAALIATSAGILNYWTGAANIPGLTEGVVYVALPIILVLVNCFEVSIYGGFEVVTGAIKITFFFIIIICLGYHYAKSGISPNSATSWGIPLEFDSTAAAEWSGAFLMSLSIATFAYTGVEIIAASAIEASLPKSPRIKTQPATQQPTTQQPTTQQPTTQQPATQQPGWVARTSHKKIKAAASLVPVLIAIAYTSSGLLVSLGIDRTDCGLPRLSWASNATCIEENEEEENAPSSPFVLIAKRSGVPGLDHAFIAFLVFTALTCANTNLYVASRALFGLTRNIHDDSIFMKFLAWFGYTNRYYVPARAVFGSAISFCWVPFLQISGGFDTVTDVGKFVEILGQMGSVSVLIVWACVCLAYIRYYIYVSRRMVQQGEEDSDGREQFLDKHPYKPFRSHWQPPLAYFAFGSCIFILVICNGAFLWKGFLAFPFLAGYLTTIVFIVLWLILKMFRGSLNRRRFFVDLNEQTVNKVIMDLNGLRDSSLEQTGKDKTSNTERDE